MLLQFQSKFKWLKTKLTKWNLILWSGKGTILFYEVFCKVKQLKTWCKKMMKITCLFLVMMSMSWWMQNLIIQWYFFNNNLGNWWFVRWWKRWFLYQRYWCTYCSRQSGTNFNKIRKNNTQVLKSMSMNKIETTCMFIMKSCSHLSH